MLASLSQELVDRETDRQTHGRGYMYLAQSVYSTAPAGVCPMWASGLANGVIGGERQPETSVETVDPR